jgi:DNA-binding transcriptional LysR family regulator
MRFTLRQIEIFAAVARFESISRATGVLSLSQSATSTALAELERQYDAPLFDRIGKSLRLNDLGKQLLPQAVELLDRTQGIDDLLSSRQGYGHLNIGASMTIGNYLATLIAADFLQVHPESKVQLAVRNTASITEGLLSFDLDLGLVEGMCIHPDLQVTPWIDDELVVFCAPGHALTKQKRLTLDDVREAPWIMRERGSGTRNLIDQALAGQHIQPRIKLELEHTEAIKRVVEAGVGVGCISRLALRDAFRRGSLVPLSTPALDLRRTFNFVLHRQKQPTASIRQFLAACQAFTAGASNTSAIRLPNIA